MDKPRLKVQYKEVAKVLADEYKVKNPMALPKIEKVVINSGTGEGIKNKDFSEGVLRDLATITGQKPSVRQAKVSVASFGIRRGMPVGMKITLRGDRMYEFLDRLFSIALPRLRDFRGLSIKSFDASGNYTIGIQEHTVFPEIDVTKIVKPFGLEITIVTNTRNKDRSKRLLELMGMPFEKS